MPASQVGLPTVVASHRFADVTIDKFTDSERGFMLIGSITIHLWKISFAYQVQCELFTCPAWFINS